MLEKGMEDGHLPLESLRAGPATRYDSDPRAAAAWDDETALSVLNQSIADVLSLSLSRHLDARVKATAGGTEILPYRDFLLSLDPTTWIGVLHVHPPGVQMCIDIPLGLLQPARHLPHVGSTEPSQVQPAAEISRALEAAASALASDWSSGLGGAVTTRMESLETNPNSLRIMPAEERVTVLRLETTIGGMGTAEASGLIRLCLPQPIIQHLLAATSRPLYERSETGVELRVVLAETPLRLSDLLAMKVGDVITTDQPVDSLASLTIDDDTAIPCIPGQLRGMRAVRITQPPESLRVGAGWMQQPRGESA